MDVLGAVVLAVVLVAEAPESRPDPPPVRIAMTALQATLDGVKEPRMDRDARAVSEALVDLKGKFDTYRNLRVLKTVAPYRQETKLAINDRYTLYLTPLSKDDNDRIRCKVRISMKVEEKVPNPAASAAAVRTVEKNAVDCTFLAVPGKLFKLTGSLLKLDEGQLVVVLVLTES